MTQNQATVRWRKSTRSGGNGGDCIEVAHTLHALRDSKNPTGPILFGPVEGLLNAVRTGR